MVNFAFLTSFRSFRERGLARLAVDDGEESVVVNLDHLLAHPCAAIAERGHNTAPIGVPTGPRCLDQFGLGDSECR